jgi:hypothetical protein
MVRRLAIALCLLTASCTVAGGQSHREHGPAVPIAISTGQALLGAGAPFCEGIFSYRGVSYLVEIDGCPQGYAGSGVIHGLDGEETIAGDYIANPGSSMWRNPNGVTIDLSPPLPTGGNLGRLRIDYAGAALPRQS